MGGSVPILEPCSLLSPKGAEPEEREKAEGRKENKRGDRKPGGGCLVDHAYLEGEIKSNSLFFPNVDFNI